MLVKQKEKNILKAKSIVILTNKRIFSKNWDFLFCYILKEKKLFV